MELERLYCLYRNSAGATTDSRSVGKGEIFFALRGPTHDGNSYAAAALEAGALAAVVDDPSIRGERIIVVDDVLETMTALASSHRHRLPVPMIAITGTNGKTTTKELLAAVLSRKGRVHSTPGNYNNHIGVPLTLLSAPDDVAFMVVEMGASHSGEIASLCMTARPTHGLITNIGTAHIEGFGSPENIITAKDELFRWLGGNGGTIIYNDEDELVTGLARNHHGAVPYSSPGSHRLTAVTAGGEGMMMKVKALIDGSEYAFDTALFGNYNIDNVRAAMAAGLLFDIPAGEIVEAISAYRPDNNRSQVTTSSRNIIIRDSYNANPTSMEQALNSFGALHAGPKMVILGDMLELGEMSDEGHASVIRQLSEMGEVTVLLVGPRFREAAGTIPARLFATAAEAATWLAHEKPEGYTILVKGSRSMMLEKVYPSL